MYRSTSDHSHQVPQREASRVGVTPLSNGSRVVQTRFGVKVEVLGSGMLGDITLRSVWVFAVEVLIGLGVAFTATELVLSLAASPPGRVRRLVALVVGGDAAATAACGALYHQAAADLSTLHSHQD